MEEVLENYKRNPLFSAPERLTLELAERMTYTQKRVTDRFFIRLQKHFIDQELVELAAIIALENFRSKFNPVFAVESQNFCPLPRIRAASAVADARLRSSSSP